MKKTLLVCVILLIVAQVFAADIIQDPVRCDANTFSIMPWGTEVSEGSIVDYDHYFQDIYECGFNVAGFMPVDKLDLAKKNKVMSSVYSLGMIDRSIENKQEMYDDWAKKTRAAIGDENLSNVFQVYLKDEPNVVDIPDLVLMSESVRKYIGVKPYINLFPSYASDYHFDGLSRYEYYKKVVDDCKLDFVSYDNYSLFVGEGLDENRFYKNLEIVSKVAKESKVDFVNIILSMAHFNYALPDEYSINVQGWSTLAYGGKGLSYFLFHSANRGNYRGGAYDRYGSKTPLWYVIRNMNFAIHNIMPYYKDLTHVNTFHIGNVPETSNDIKSAKCIKTLEASIDKVNSKNAGPFKNQKNLKPNLVVGEFIGQGTKQYAIIVNKDPNYSVQIKKLEFLKGDKVKHIQDYTIDNKICDFAGEDIWLAPGYGILVYGE